jgi:hypothetical protein
MPSHRFDGSLFFFNIVFGRKLHTNCGQVGSVEKANDRVQLVDFVERCAVMDQQLSVFTQAAHEFFFLAKPVATRISFPPRRRWRSPRA